LTVENIDMEDRSRIFSPKLDYTCRSVLLTNYLRWQCLTPVGFGMTLITNLMWFCARISKREGKKLFV